MTNHDASLFGLLFVLVVVLTLFIAVWLLTKGK
jgi:hypothetical protein